MIDCLYQLVLLAIVEVYTSNDADNKFVDDFVKVWMKAMQLDSFE